MFANKVSVILSVLCVWCVVQGTYAKTISNHLQCFLPDHRESICKPLSECNTLMEAIERNKGDGKGDRTSEEVATYKCTHNTDLAEYCCPDFAINTQNRDDLEDFVVFAKDPNYGAPPPTPAGGVAAIDNTNLDLNLGESFGAEPETA